MDAQLRKREPIGNGVFVYTSPHHTFSTDSILLAHFAAARQNDTLVDLGTGSGIIPLLMLRNGSLNGAVGIDISAEAVSLAEQGAEQFSEKFSVLHGDFCNLKGKIAFGCHTLVTCNPPFKAAGAGLQNPDSVSAAVRHETDCTLEDIVQTAARLLQTAGRFCICHRPERLSELMRLCAENKLEPKRLRIVCKEAGREPWLVLLECKKCANVGLRIAPPLFVWQNGAISPEMREIYGCYKENAASE